MINKSLPFLIFGLVDVVDIDVFAFVGLYYDVFGWTIIGVYVLS